MGMVVVVEMAAAILVEDCRGVVLIAVVVQDPQPVVGLFAEFAEFLLEYLLPFLVAPICLILYRSESRCLLRYQSTLEAEIGGCGTRSVRDAEECKTRDKAAVRGRYLQLASDCWGPLRLPWSVFPPTHRLDGRASAGAVR